MGGSFQTDECGQKRSWLSRSVAGDTVCVSAQAIHQPRLRDASCKSAQDRATALGVATSWGLVFSGVRRRGFTRSR